MHDEPQQQPLEPDVPASGQPSEAIPDELPIVEGYDVIDLIGQGGMGLVYEAFQSSTGRRVALKLMLERMAATESARRRFEREVELVARLEHPNIVRVVDSGVNRGRYFYVMEFVEGKPLDEAALPGKSDIRTALALVAKVALAVDYAHQRGVMHRDLKPGNIIVDERGEPRLLDFGLAKAFDPGSLMNQRQSLSEAGQVIGTLGYMSPEQARGAVHEVSVRSDVYALGAIAYELIAGALPCAIDGPLAVVFQRIEARDPERPSAQRRGVPADVDAILLKALEKAPARRYATAADFAADIEAFLASRPVSARRTGVLPRAVRWCRRNPAGAAAVGLAVLVALVGGGAAWITSKKEAARLRAELAQANAERAQANAERDAESRRAVFGQVFEQLDPTNPEAVQASLVLLRTRAADLDRGGLPPEEEAEGRMVLGDRFRKFGEPDAAEPQFRRALELFDTVRTRPDEKIAWCLRHLGATYFDQGQYEQSEAFYRQALDMRLQLYGPGDHADIADSMNHLAACLTRQRRHEEALQLQLGVLEMRRRLFPENSEEVVSAVNNLGTVYIEAGEVDKAEAMYSEALSRMIKLVGREHPYVARGLKSVARCRLAKGELEGVDAMLDEALGILQRTYGPDHPEVALTRVDQAKLWLELRQPDLAEAACRQALRSLEAKRRPAHPDITNARLVLAESLRQQQRFDEAGAEIEIVQSALSADPRCPPWQLAEVRAAGAAVLIDSGRAAQAVVILRDSMYALEAERGSVDPRTRRCVEQLARALSAMGDEAGASEVLARLQPRE